ncbi:MAG: hypothetical protein QM767_13040 [Anaeromyxobacter sp.]
MRSSWLCPSLRFGLLCLFPVVAQAGGFSERQVQLLIVLCAGASVILLGMLRAGTLEPMIAGLWHQLRPPRPAPTGDSPDDFIRARHAAELEQRTATYSCLACGGRTHPPGDPAEYFRHRGRDLSVHVMRCRRCGTDRRIYALLG